MDEIKSKRIVRGVKENLSDLIKFCEEHNRLPQLKNGGVESRLASFMCRYSKNAKVIKIKEDYRVRFGYSNVDIHDKGLSDLLEFCKKNGRIPNPSNGHDEWKLRGIMNLYKDTQEVKDIKVKYCKRKVRV